MGDWLVDGLTVLPLVMMVLGQRSWLRCCCCLAGVQAPVRRVGGHSIAQSPTMKRGGVNGMFTAVAPPLM